MFYNSITIRFMARAISCYHGDSVICVKISGNEEYDSKFSFFDINDFLGSVFWGERLNKSFD